MRLYEHFPVVGRQHWRYIHHEEMGGTSVVFG